MEKILKWILDNWKSNLSGLIGLSLVALLVKKQITLEEFSAISGSLASIGLLIHNEKQ
jgi:hypothetical protein